MAMILPRMSAGLSLKHWDSGMDPRRPVLAGRPERPKHHTGVRRFCRFLVPSAARLGKAREPTPVQSVSCGRGLLLTRANDDRMSVVICGLDPRTHPPSQGRRIAG